MTKTVLMLSRSTLTRQTKRPLNSCDLGCSFHTIAKLKSKAEVLLKLLIWQSQNHCLHMYTKLKIDKLVRNTLALSSTQQSKTSQPLSNGHHFDGPNWTDGTCFSIWHGICALPRGQSNLYIPTLWNFVDIGHLVIKQMAKPRFET